MGMLRAGATGLLLLGWVVASHLGSLGIGPMDLHVAVALLPLIAALAMVLARAPARARRVLAWVGVVVLLWALWLIWPLLRTQVAALYLLQHLGVHLALAALFGMSLFGGGDALVTRFARGVFGPELSPRNLRYTRQATAAWALFFLLNAGVSVLLFLLAPREVWSLHANVLTGPLLGLMFLLEALWRRLVLPAHERPGLGDALRAWQRDAERRQALRGKS